MKWKGLVLMEDRNMDKCKDTDKRKKQVKCCPNEKCNCKSPNCQGDCRCNCNKPHGSGSDSEGNHDCSFDSMCHGVFAPICEPEVCDIPRILHYQDLVVGDGVITQNTNEIGYCKETYQFHIHIYRRFLSYFGEFTLWDSKGVIMVESDQLECFHTKSKDKMVAIFHVVYEDETSREVTVYAKPSSCKESASLYVYSAPLFHEEISIGSDLIQGKIEIFLDEAGHEH